MYIVTVQYLKNLGLICMNNDKLVQSAIDEALCSVLLSKIMEHSKDEKECNEIFKFNGVYFQCLYSARGTVYRTSTSVAILRTFMKSVITTQTYSCAYSDKTINNITYSEFDSVTVRDTLEELPLLSYPFKEEELFQRTLVLDDTQLYVVLFCSVLKHYESPTVIVNVKSIRELLRLHGAMINDLRKEWGYHVLT